MKWFKHYSDAYSNLKHQQVISQFGLRGYGFFWVCVEFVAQQGQNSRIKAEKKWKNVLSFITRERDDDIEKMLSVFADVGLIDKKGLEIGDLYVPKIRDYSDEYTDKLRRKSRHSPDIVGLDKIRIDKNRLDKSIGDTETPSQVAKDFFSKGTHYEEMFTIFSKDRDPTVIRREFEKFLLYWTEPNKSGTKVRWEQQDTFDVKRRLFTWLNRSFESNRGGQRNTGRGLET
jgi:hypothetical protein